MKIEREKAAFETWWRNLYTMPADIAFNWTSPAIEEQFETWLAAKRSMLGSAEPVTAGLDTVAWLIEDYDRNDKLRKRVVLSPLTDHLDESAEAIPLCKIEDAKAILAAPPAPVSAESDGKESREQLAARLITECHADIASLEAIKLPPHDPTIGIEELLSGYLPDDRKDHWETIKAYADVHARSAVQLSAPRQECPGDTKITSAPASTDAKDSERMFPMQHPCLPIPWKTAEIIYAGYASVYGTTQSMEKMAARGGFGWGEVGVIYREPRAKNLMDKLSRAAIAAKESGK